MNEMKNYTAEITYADGGKHVVGLRVHGDVYALSVTEARNLGVKLLELAGVCESLDDVTEEEEEAFVSMEEDKHD